MYDNNHLYLLTSVLLFRKILKKLQSHDEKIAQNERKTIGKKKKKGFWQSDNKDSGLDESNSVCDDVQGTVAERGTLTVI